MKDIFLALICMAALAGCAQVPTQQSAPIDPPYELDAPTIRAQMMPGHAIIRGQAFSKTRGGEVKYGAGNPIRVLPNTKYVATCMSLVVAGYQTTCMATLMPMARTVTADGEGRFEITDLRPGQYQLSTFIAWEIPGPFGLQQTGGVIFKVVDVPSDTDIVSAMLNGQ